eukprot:g26088.t1
MKRPTNVGVTSSDAISSPLGPCHRRATDARSHAEPTLTLQPAAPTLLLPPPADAWSFHSRPTTNRVPGSAVSPGRRLTKIPALAALHCNVTFSAVNRKKMKKKKSKDDKK